MKMFVLTSALLLTGLFAGTAFGQCQGGGGRGAGGGRQSQGPGMMSMQGGTRGSGSPMMAQMMMQQQALMQQAMIQQIVAAQEKERLRQEKKDRHVANVKQRKASEDARRAERRAQLVAASDK